jgi:hypothetical protein
MRKETCEIRFLVVEIPRFVVVGDDSFGPQENAPRVEFYRHGCAIVDSGSYRVESRA